MRVVVVAVKLVHFLAAHGFVAVGAIIGEVEDGDVQFSADVFGPLRVLPAAGAAFDFIQRGVVVGGERGDRGGVFDFDGRIRPDVPRGDGEEDDVGALRL